MLTHRSPNLAVDYAQWLRQHANHLDQLDVTVSEAIAVLAALRGDPGWLPPEPTPIADEAAEALRAHPDDPDGPRGEVWTIDPADVEPAVLP